jgi:hypothetical protein
MHSVYCIEVNSKSGVEFWGVIADSYNSTTEQHRRHTAKNLKDYWIAYNKHVSLFNQIYNQESSHRQSGANDAIIIETINEQIRIGPVPNSSASIAGKLLDTNPNGWQGRMPHL